MARDIAMVLFLKNLLFTVVAPGTVAVGVPFVIARDRSPVSGPALGLAFVFFSIGAAIYTWCVVDFAVRGLSQPGGPLASPNQEASFKMRFFGYVVATIVAASAIGCVPQPSGDFRFVESGDVPDGKAVVYLYRPPSVLGTVDVCNMEINGEMIGALDAARYSQVFVEPGQTRFETTGDFRAFVTVNLEEDKEYFIRQTWLFHQTGLRPRLENMTRIKAETELATCTFVEAPPIIDPPDNEEGER